jgi:hypothetical protein
MGNIFPTVIYFIPAMIYFASVLKKIAPAHIDLTAVVFVWSPALIYFVVAVIKVVPTLFCFSTAMIQNPAAVIYWAAIMTKNHPCPLLSKEGIKGRLKFYFVKTIFIVCVNGLEPS